MTERATRTLFALAVLLAGTALGASTAVGIDGQTTTESDTRIAFGDGEMETERGGNVTIPVELEGTDTATLEIGREDVVNYALVVTVTDGNGDGSVVVEFDTDAAGEDDAAKVTTRDGADDVAVESEVEHVNDEPPHPPLAADNYPVALYEGTGDDRVFVQVSEMRVLESETTTVGETTDVPTEEPTTTDIVTEPEPTDTTETTSDGTDPADGVGDVPGFGPALTLAALAAAAALAARR